MMENEHIIIAVNDKEASPEHLERLQEHRGRSRSRKRGNSRSQSTSRSRSGRDIEAATVDSSLLIPESALPRQKPPERGPEIDSDENTDENDSPTNGIDDGFFNDSELDGPTRVKPPTFNVNEPRRGSKVPVFPSTFPLSPGFSGPGIVMNGETPRIIPDINVYQHKKSLAQGFMDLALLSANANQLRYVLESHDRHPYYYFSLSFIVFSLIVQVIVGVGLVLNSRYDIRNQDDICKADRINNYITVGILLITIVNVFISAFGVAENR